jgi:hypothetical protein
MRHIGRGELWLVVSEKNGKLLESGQEYKRVLGCEA